MHVKEGFPIVRSMLVDSLHCIFLFPQRDSVRIPELPAIPDRVVACGTRFPWGLASFSM